MKHLYIKTECNYNREINGNVETHIVYIECSLSSKVVKHKNKIQEIIQIKWILYCSMIGNDHKQTKKNTQKKQTKKNKQIKQKQKNTKKNKQTKNKKIKAHINT